MHPPGTRPIVPAAQYLRMSTEHQRYSPDNQKAAIAAYAEKRGYEIVETYLDSGKSGLTLHGRDGLKRLLGDAVSGNGGFKAILVLDVSRWGRFQDIDQGGHYEWLCRSAGVAVHYVAEQFEQDGSTASSLLKQLKRVMAGEYSRELSAKVAFAQARNAAAGYLQGASAPYGVRRLVVDENGSPKCVLEYGEWKAMRWDRVVAIPGPAAEIAVLKRIFRLRASGASCQAIADRLNAKGILSARRTPWTLGGVASTIRNDLVLGRCVYNRTSTRLKSPRRVNDAADWICFQAFPPLVDPKLVERARKRGPSIAGNAWSERMLLRDLRQLYIKNGRLSARLIALTPEMAHPRTYENHFGSLDAAYRLVGYGPTKRVRVRRPTITLSESELLAALKRCHDQAGYISSHVIDADRTIPSMNYFRTRFGSLANAYRLAGIPYVDRVSSIAEGKRRGVRKRDADSTPPPESVAAEETSSVAISENVVMLVRGLSQNGLPDLG